MIKTANWDGVEQDNRWQEGADQTILTYEEPAYPLLLKHIYDPPVVLYVKGSLRGLSLKTVGMVGTRKPSMSGRHIARRMAKELAEAGVCVVSGLAQGIDAEVHQGCLLGQGPTIAVMGTGIDRIYPAQHQALAAKIAAQGALITEFPLQSAPCAGHFPRRNRIISGLSSSILVVEASIRSGSLITARMALEQNRGVMAIPGSLHNPQSRGCHFLLQQGAKLVVSTADVLEDLQILAQEGHVLDVFSQETSMMTLASDARTLVQCIGFEPTSMDKIIGESGFLLKDVMCILAELELQGWVEAVPGGYMRCIA